MDAEFNVFRTNRFGVDRDERFGTSERLDVSAELCQNVRDDVAAHCGMLVHTDGEAGKSLFAEEGDVAVCVVFTGGRVFCWKGGRGLEHALGELGIFDFEGFGSDARFVFLRNFTLRVVKFDAVAVGWNMASGDHDGRESLFDPVKGDRRARNASAVNDLPIHIDGGRRESL